MKKLDLKRARQLAIVAALFTAALFGQSAAVDIAPAGIANATGIDWPR